VTRLPFSLPVEVSAENMKVFGNRIQDGRHKLFEDVMRRLEQTENGKALRYEFDDKDTALRYRTFVSYRSHKRLGKGKLCSRVEDGGERVYVYFTRGPKWDRS
jgi:hypothetical protein